MKTTPNQLIHIGKPILFDPGKFLEDLGKLAEASYSNRDDIYEIVESVVPTYKPGHLKGNIKLERHILFKNEI